MAYIERESAIKSLLNDCLGQVSYSREDAADCIRYMDAADVSPVGHGRWILEETKGGFHMWVCSRCGRGVNRDPEGIDLYCYHCGAKMDEEVSE